MRGGRDSFDRLSGRSRENCPELVHFWFIKRQKGVIVNGGGAAGMRDFGLSFNLSALIDLDTTTVRKALVWPFLARGLLSRKADSSEASTVTGARNSCGFRNPDNYGNSGHLG